MDFSNSKFSPGRVPDKKKKKEIAGAAEVLNTSSAATSLRTGIGAKRGEAPREEERRGGPHKTSRRIKPKTLTTRVLSTTKNSGGGERRHNQGDSGTA